MKQKLFQDSVSFPHFQQTFLSIIITVIVWVIGVTVIGVSLLMVIIFLLLSLIYHLLYPRILAAMALNQNHSSVLVVRRISSRKIHLIIISLRKNIVKLKQEFVLMKSQKKPKKYFAFIYLFIYFWGNFVCNNVRFYCFIIL